MDNGNLVASHPGNTNAARHGAYSQRLREPRAREIAEAILAAPHTSALDEVGAVEIGRLEALIECLDEAIVSSGVVNTRTNKPRAVIDLRLRASRRLHEWLESYGMTPRGRASWVPALERETLAEALRRRRELT